MIEYHIMACPVCKLVIRAKTHSEGAERIARHREKEHGG